MRKRRQNRCGLLAALGMAVLTWGSSGASAEPAVPSWRGQVPGTAWLGPDILWRPRENLIFHMLDESGGGFTLDVSVRDMNVYMQMPADTWVWVLGPGDETLARVRLEDDGVVSGAPRFADGVYDVYMDLRYREWHRVHSPGGRPPGRERSPHLDAPERLPARWIQIQVPDAGPGLYRVMVMGRWDHWVSITPDRPLPTGVHPGAGPLALHGAHLEESYLYVPPGTEEVGLSLLEEIQPFNWSLRIEAEDGTEAARTPPARNFLQYLVFEPPRQDTVYRLRIEGETAGAHLHLQGVPFVLAPDAETARRLRGGMLSEAGGDGLFFRHQLALRAWRNSLTPEDLAVPDRPVDLDAIEERPLRTAIEGLAEALAAQSTDPDDPRFGRLARARLDQLGRAAGSAHPANPYHGDPALLRRVFLGSVVPMVQMSPYFQYSIAYDFPKRFDVREESFFSLPLRSNWYSLGGDSWHTQGAAHVRDRLGDVLPPDAAAAWLRSCEMWSEARWNMHVAEISNQWLYNLTSLVRMAELTGNDDIRDRVRVQLRQLLTPDLFGRRAPDPPPSTEFAVDSGHMRTGLLSEAGGWDSSYVAWCQEGNLFSLYASLGEEAILDYLAEYAQIKAHLTLPKGGEHVAERWQAVCSPSDINFRTEGQLLNDSMGRLPEDVRGRIPYTDLEQSVWPCLETEPFVRSMADFRFIHTGGYYSILYLGPTNRDDAFFSRPVFGEGSVSMEGYAAGRMRQRKTTKPGAVSAIYVPGCGPTLLGQNYDAMFAHALWGRTPEPIHPVWGDGVDARMVSSAFVDTHSEFDANGRILRESGRLTYAPLHFTRTLHFRPDRVAVTVDLLGLDDVELEELHEAFPLVVDHRHVRLWDGDWSMRVLYEGTARAPKAERAEEATETVPVRAFGVSAPGGAGTVVVLDRPGMATLHGAYRYRDIAIATRPLSLRLPARLAAGERFTYRYVIHSHREAVGTADLQRIAQEEGFQD